MISAPFTPEQVEALNKFQQRQNFHPFTCGNRGDPPHQEDMERLGLTDLGLLKATPLGWVCHSCAYTQTWAHGFMAEAI